jgi:putative transposase
MPKGHRKIPGLDTNNHSVFKITLHCIICVKYRRRVLTDPLAEYIFDIFRRIGANHNITLLEANHDIDHIHVLMKIHPNTHLSTFFNAFKSASSRLVKRDFPEVTTKLWKKYFWSSSYCLLSVGGASLEAVADYIETQGEQPEKRPRAVRWDKGRKRGGARAA